MATRFLVTGAGKTWDGASTNLWAATTGGASGASAPTVADDVVVDANSGLTAGAVLTIAAGAVCKALTVAGPAVKDAVFTLSTNLAPAGAVAITGNSAINRLLIQSSVAGTARTLTAATMSLSNVDFKDITGAGAAAPFTGTSLGDCLGNSGITFTAAVTQTATGTASFSWSTHGWTTRVPLPQDNVIINNAFVAGRTITVDMPRIGKNIDLSGCTGAPIFSWTVPISSFGNVAMAASVLPSGGTNGWTMMGRGAQTITNNGVAWKTFVRLTVAAVTGSYAMLDAHTQDPNNQPSSFTVSSGTLNTGGFVMTFGTLTVAALATLTLNGSVVNLNCTVAATLVSIAATANISAAGSNFVMPALSGAKTFAGGGKSFGTLTDTSAKSAGALTITGANTFDAIVVAAGRQVVFPASTTTTVNRWAVVGAPNAFLYLPGLTGNYASAPDSVPLSITGDIDIRAKVALDDWTPAAAGVVVAKDDPVATGLSHQLHIATNGLPTFTLSADGSTPSAAAASVAPTVGDGLPLWLRVTWRKSDGRVQFFTAPATVVNPVAADWTQLGTDRSIVVAAIFDSAAGLEIGSRGSGTSIPLAMNVYRVQVRSNILDNGTGIVFDADFSAKAFGVDTFAESSANGATVTVTGGTAQAGDGRVALTSSAPGTQATLAKTSGVLTSNYLTVKDSKATGTYWFAGQKSVNKGNNSVWVFTDKPLTMITTRSVVKNYQTSIAVRQPGSKLVVKWRGSKTVTNAINSKAPVTD